MGYPRIGVAKGDHPFAAPDSAQSVALRLVVAAPKALPAGTYANVLFDNILVLAQ